MDYLRYYAEEQAVPVFSGLQATLNAAIHKIGEGSLRQGGETFVPFDIWKTPSFQRWYGRTIVASGNRLDDVRVRWVNRQGPEKKVIFLWIIQAKVWVEKEGRHAHRELVVGRLDISAIVLFHRGVTFDKTRVVLIREFRNAVSNSHGFVLELPSGSSFKPNPNPLDLMRDELLEETGITVLPDRIRIIADRQLVSTLSCHHALVGSVELTDAEMSAIEKHQGNVHGNVLDKERTYLEVRTLRQLLESDQMDWSNLGMIFSALQ